MCQFGLKPNVQDWSAFWTFGPTDTGEIDQTSAGADEICQKACFS